jgi:hypothetical protein
VGSSFNRYVFMHVGSDISVPQMLVKSIRRVDNDSEIICCSDLQTPNIDGVNTTYRIELDSTHLMVARLSAFKNLRLRAQALYIDTDMLMVSKPDLDALASLGKDAFVCRREFYTKSKFNGKQFNGAFKEFENLALSSVFPYVACATFTKDFTFWESCTEILESLDPKYAYWYGDQKSIDLLIQRSLGSGSIGQLKESQFGCLPEFTQYLTRQPYFLHFKGSRKNDMRKVFERLYNENIAG